MRLGAFPSLWKLHWRTHEKRSERECASVRCTVARVKRVCTCSSREDNWAHWPTLTWVVSSVLALEVHAICAEAQVAATLRLPMRRSLEVATTKESSRLCRLVTSSSRAKTENKTCSQLAREHTHTHTHTHKWAVCACRHGSSVS